MNDDSLGAAVVVVVVGATMQSSVEFIGNVRISFNYLRQVIANEMIRWNDVSATTRLPTRSNRNPIGLLIEAEATVVPKLAPGNHR